jgi:hypothetical protein
MFVWIQGQTVIQIDTIGENPQIDSSLCRANCASSAPATTTKVGCTSKSLASDPGLSTPNPTGAVADGACVFSNSDHAVEQCHFGTWHRGVVTPDQDGDGNGLFAGTGPFGPCAK